MIVFLNRTHYLPLSLCSPLPVTWVQWPFFWIPLSLRPKFNIKFCPLNSSMQPWMFPAALSPELYWLLIVVSYHSPFTSCDIQCGLDLSSSRFRIHIDIRLHHMILMIFGEPGKISTSAIATQPNFVSATHTLDAFKHGMTCSAWLIISPMMSWRRIN